MTTYFHFLFIFIDMKIKKCELYNLLNDTCLAYYWIGFILADGSISKSGELKIALSIKDKDHLKKMLHL